MQTARRQRASPFSAAAPLSPPAQELLQATTPGSVDPEGTRRRGSQSSLTYFPHSRHSLRRQQQRKSQVEIPPPQSLSDLTAERRPCQVFRAGLPSGVNGSCLQPGGPGSYPWAHLAGAAPVCGRSSSESSRGRHSRPPSLEQLLSEASSVRDPLHGSSSCLRPPSLPATPHPSSF